MAVGLVDSHVEADAAHHLHGAGEPSTVAQLRRHHHRGERADPAVVAVKALQAGWRRANRSRSARNGKRMASVASRM